MPSSSSTSFPSRETARLGFVVTTEPIAAISRMLDRGGRPTVGEVTVGWLNNSGQYQVERFVPVAAQQAFQTLCKSAGSIFTVKKTDDFTLDSDFQ